jgi:L-alanine-DL-glutamate epimerase-like enolase superfamily enzyme
MAIASIATWTDNNACLVEVRADDGARGLGQCAPYHAAITAEVLHALVAPEALGKAEEPIGALVEGIFEKYYKFHGSFLCRAMCGLDTALWDLAARRRGVPVCVLAGGRPRTVPVYASSMRRDIPADDEAERLARLRDAHGFRAFKGKVGPRRGGSADPARTPALITGLRRRLGPAAVLIADANGSYAPDDALPVARLLAEDGYAAFEEPCPHDELEMTALVRSAGILPIAGGEQDHGLPLWRRLATDCFDLCQPDIGYVGGFHRALAIAAIADAAGRPTTPHTANRSLLQIFSLHLMCAIARPWDYLECSIEAAAWVDGLLRQPLAVRDGAIACPDGPGWGIEIDPARLARMHHHISQRN